MNISILITRDGQFWKATAYHSDAINLTLCTRLSSKGVVKPVEELGESPHEAVGFLVIRRLVNTGLEIKEIKINSNHTYTREYCGMNGIDWEEKL